MKTARSSGSSTKGSLAAMSRTNLSALAMSQAPAGLEGRGSWAGGTAGNAIKGTGGGDKAAAEDAAGADRSGEAEAEDGAGDPRTGRAPEVPGGGRGAAVAGIAGGEASLWQPRRCCCTTDRHVRYGSDLLPAIATQVFTSEWGCCFKLSIKTTA